MEDFLTMLQTIRVLAKKHRSSAHVTHRWSDIDAAARCEYKALIDELDFMIAKIDGILFHADQIRFLNMQQKDGE